MRILISPETIESMLNSFAVDSMGLPLVFLTQLFSNNTRKNIDVPV